MLIKLGRMRAQLMKLVTGIGAVWVAILAAVTFFLAAIDYVLAKEYLPPGKAMSLVSRAAIEINGADPHATSRAGR